MVNGTRTPIVGGNWKMNANRARAGQLLHALRAALEGSTDVEVVVCPSTPWLGNAADAFATDDLLVGAQNVYWEREGAFTGEQNAEMLVGTASHVIVGHSERRQVFEESDDLIRHKLATVIAAGLTPILAIGELQAERVAGQTSAVLERQLLGACDGLDALPSDAVVAYEPVWAIGTGLAATPELAQEVVASIRVMVADRFGTESAANVRIQYGGSVNAENASDFASQPDIDGALVGGASLNAADFASICGAFGHAHRIARA